MFLLVYFSIFFSVIFLSISSEVLPRILSVLFYKTLPDITFRGSCGSIFGFLQIFSRNSFRRYWNSPAKGPSGISTEIYYRILPEVASGKSFHSFSQKKIFRKYLWKTTRYSSEEPSGFPFTIILGIPFRVLTRNL